MPALGALAAPELVLVALMGVLLLYATRQLWVPFLIWLLSQIPVVGGWVAGQAARLINDAFNWIGGRIHDTVGVLTTALSRIVSRARAWVLAVESALAATAQAVVHLVNQLLPALEQRAQQYAATLVQALGNLVAAVYHAALQAAQVAEQAAVAYALGLYHLTLEAIARVNVQLSQLIDREVRALVAWVQATAVAIITRGDTQVAQAEANARAEAQAAADYAAKLAGDAEQYARDLVIGAEGVARGLVLDAEKAASLANAQTLAAALAAVGVVAVSVDAIRNLECIKQCNPLGQLGNELASLDLAALIALVALAARDPKAASQLIQGTVGPVVSDGATLLRSTVGP